MRRALAWTLMVGLLMFLTPAAQAQVESVGTGVADANGGGAIDIAVDATADPTLVADQLRANLQLTEGATVQSITVENGIAHIEFANAAAGATVEATLPTEIASAIGIGGAIGGGATMGTAALVGGGALVVGGGVVGGLAAAGEFEGEDKGSPSE